MSTWSRDHQSTVFPLTFPVLDPSLEESICQTFQKPVLAFVVEFVVLGSLPVSLWRLVHRKAVCFVLEDHDLT